MEKANLADKYAILQDDMETRNGPKVERARCIWPVTLLLLALSIFAVVYFFYPIKDDGYFTRVYYNQHHNHHHHHNGKWHDRPPYNDKAKMARYIVHNSNWGVLTTFCTHFKGYPWGEVVSITDGLVNNSTGIPLIYISVMDVAAKDLEINPMASFTFSEAESDWCRQHSVDPEDPRCSRVHLFGKIVKLKDEEIPAAKKAMFTKHPVMAKWPPSHEFFFAKIELTKVEVLDYFGPLSNVSIDDYLKAKI